MLPKEYELGESTVGVEFVEVHNSFHEVKVAEYSLKGDTAGFLGKAINSWVDFEDFSGHGGRNRLRVLSGWGKVGRVSSFIFLEDGPCVSEIAFWFPSIFSRRETFPGYQVLTTSGSPTVG